MGVIRIILQLFRELTITVRLRTLDQNPPREDVVLLGTIQECILEAYFALDAADSIFGDFADTWMLLKETVAAFVAENELDTCIGGAI